MSTLGIASSIVVATYAVFMRPYYAFRFSKWRREDRGLRPLVGTSGSRGLRPATSVVLMCLSASLCGAPAEAADFNCSSGDVSCLVDAIHQANANGHANTIRLAAGVYTLTAVDNQADGPSGLPSVASTLTITGDGAGVTSIARDAAAPVFRIFHVALGAALTLRGVTIRGGMLAGGSGVAFQGDGILALGSVNIDDSVVTHNGQSRSGRGGGVAGGNVRVTRSTISGNSAVGGGGVYIAADGNLSVEHSTIAQNVDGFDGGGGILFASQGTLLVRNSLIDSNRAGAIGLGGIGAGVTVHSAAPPSGTITIMDSTISNNSGSGIVGGGMYVASGTTIHIRRSSIVGNSANSGGGIEVEAQATVVLVDSTIASNSVGGLNVFGTATLKNSTVAGNRTGLAGSGTTTLENTILALNTGAGSDCGTTITSLGHNVIGNATGCGTLLPSDLTGDPGLGDFIDPGRPGTGHFPLLPGSRAIDAGDNTACRKEDQLRLARPIDGNGDAARVCDIGSVEFYPIVNDLVRLDSLSSTFVPASSRQPNLLTAGGEFRINAMFTNIGGRDICHVAFAVTTLQGGTGAPPVLVTPSGNLIGGEGIVMPTRLAGAESDLDTKEHERYRFRIGLSHTEPISFLVNVLGEATAGTCEK